MSSLNGINYGLFVWSDGITICNGKKNAEKLKFDYNTIKKLEVIDKNKLKEELKHYLITNKIKIRKAIIILSKEVVFEKTIRSIKKEERETELEKFWSEVPFEPEKIVKKSYKNKKITVAIATNRQIYEDFREAIEDMNGKVVAVIPQSAFKNLSENNWQIVLSHPTIVREADFVCDN